MWENEGLSPPKAGWMQVVTKSSILFFLLGWITSLGKCWALWPALLLPCCLTFSSSEEEQKTVSWTSNRECVQVSLLTGARVVPRGACWEEGSPVEVSTCPKGLPTAVQPGAKGGEHRICLRRSVGRVWGWEKATGCPGVLHYATEGKEPLFSPTSLLRDYRQAISSWCC